MNIEEARKARGMSRKDVSRKLGIPYRSLENWEKGLSKCPDYVERLVVAEILRGGKKMTDIEVLMKNGYSKRKDMTKEEVLQHDKKFRYMLLSRMQSDCEYYLNYGNRNPKRLWAGDEQRQIEYMILLHDSFKEDEKPQWLSLDEILDYQKRMPEPVA